MEKLLPGIHDKVPMDWYHGDCCPGPSISASGLIELMRCPVKYWAFSPLNPHRFQETETKALSMGRAAHVLALGEPDFSDAFVISPHDDFRSKEARAWRDSQTKQILKAEEFETVKLMARALEVAPQVARAFESGKPEQSIIWKDKETGVYLKSRPDWLPHDPRKGFIVDYKTAVTIEPFALSNAVFNYGYHVQGAMQVDGVREVTGHLPLGIAHVCQEKDPPWLAELRMFSPEQIEIGRKFYRAAVRKFADCISSGKWPGYTADAQYFETPYRIAKQEEELDHAAFASQRARKDGSKPSAADYAGTP